MSWRTRLRRYGQVAACIGLGVLAAYRLGTSAVAQDAVLLYGTYSGAAKALTADTNGSLNVKCLSGCGGIAGADTNVLYNDGGTTVGGDANFTWAKTTHQLTITGLDANTSLAFPSVTYTSNMSSKPLISIIATENTAAGTHPYLKMSITKTAGAFNFIELYGGAGGVTSEFLVASDGHLTVGNGGTSYLPLTRFDEVILDQTAGNIGVILQNPVANVGVLQLTGTSTTSGMVSPYSFAHTLNTATAPSVFKLVVTDTAHGAGTRLFSILGGAAGATEAFNIGTGGNVGIGVAFDATQALHTAGNQAGSIGLGSSTTYGVGTTSLFIRGTSGPGRIHLISSTHTDSGSNGLMLQDDATGGYVYEFENLPIFFGINGATVAQLTAAGVFTLGSGTDTGLARNAAGVLEVNSGTAGTFRDVKFRTGTLTGLIGTYNNINTVSNGVPSELATVDLTAQTASIGATTLYTPAASGMFRVCAVLHVTTAGSVSSILGGTTGITLAYTEPDGSVAQTALKMALDDQTGNVVVPTNGNTTNTTQATSQGCNVIYAKTGVAITYAVGYTSVNAAEMNYSLHMKVEAQ